MSTTGTPTVPGPSKRGARLWLVPFGTGLIVAVALGVYGVVHEPTGKAVNLAGFSSALAAKSWLASVAVVLAIVQLVSALAMYGKLPGVTAPSWIGGLHRWSGRAAFLFAVPVAVHCLYALGFATYSPRVLMHSLCGCFFFGAFSTKMLVLTRKGMPGWALPVLGGSVFSALVIIWLTSSLWYFNSTGVHL